MIPAPTITPVLRIDQLSVHYGKTEIVSGICLDLLPGQTVALVGGSGAGKSTVAKAIAGLARASGGSILLEGVNCTQSAPDSPPTPIDLLRLDKSQLSQARQAVNLVMQDPYASLPPHRQVADTVTEPLVIHRIGSSAERREQMYEALEVVGLDPRRYAQRLPHELSGGERQRIAFARAIISKPRVILADEPTGMLDASLRAGISNLMGNLSRELGTAFLHITHDLALAAHTSDRVVVMDQGRIVEQGTSDEVIENPQHPTTMRLLEAAFRGVRRVRGA